MSGWSGMEDDWLDSYWEERLSGPEPSYEEWALDRDGTVESYDRLEDLEDE